MIWLINIIAILIGVAMLFWGYRLFRIWLAIAGFMFGTVIGNMIASLYLPGDLWPIVLAIAVGLLFAVLAFVIYRLGAVLIGACLGALFLSLIFGLLGIAPAWWIYLIGAVLGAILAGMMVVPFIKIASAFNGAYVIMVGIFSLIQNVSIADQQQYMLISQDNLPWYFYAGVIVLAIIGIIFQMSTNKGKDLNVAKSQPGS